MALCFTVPIDVSTGSYCYVARGICRRRCSTTLVKMSASTVRSLPPVYFVLGGPGSGKGTQCQKLVSRFALKQVCAGDLLREKAVADDDVGRLVAEKIRTGQIVPGHITIELLHAALQR